MRRITQLLAGATLAMLSTPGIAVAQDTQPAPAAAAEEDGGDIVVTARRREESLQDVPVAITAITGDQLEQRGLNNVREAAVLSPGVNINSDGAGRAFVAIRGVGVTLVQSVQPGVGLFVDGIYRPNTAYLNNPLLDVERIEVLRGPQGTLYGKNTLGGAINVITRQPDDEFHVRGLVSYAGPDDSLLASASVSGPLVENLLAGRLAVAHREQDGFLENITIGGDQNDLRTDSINGTLRYTPGDITVTLNSYYDWIDGANVPYARVSGPTDYSNEIEFNDHNHSDYRYYGANARLDFTLAPVDTDVTLMLAYDGRDSKAENNDADFGPDDIARSTGNDELDSFTSELRFDTDISPTLSTLFGVFYSRETSDAFSQVSLLPLSMTNTAISRTEADTYAAFGTLFWEPNADWEVALGLRYDREERLSTGTAIIGGSPVALPDAEITSDELQPRISVTRHWSPDFMSYATVARGYRGGGFNSPVAPVRTYEGDSAWTYELGSKWESADGALNLSGAVFFSDYENYIGLNSVAPALVGGLVTVDLNTGDVESYGAEFEARWRVTDQWTLAGSYTYVHSRITDDSAYTDVTGRLLSSDRLTFQPDHQFSLTSDYEIPMGADTLVLSASAIGKGERLAATLNETTPTFLEEYVLVNGQIAYRHGPWEFAVFGTNLFEEEYYESYIEQTTLALAGLPASDLGILGDGRRVGVRISARY